MSDDRRFTARGRQYIPCDTFQQLTESEFGKFIESFIYSIDKDDMSLTVIAGNGNIKVEPYQYLFIYDGDKVFVTDREESEEEDYL